MITLSALTSHELAAVDAALLALDDALLMLLERGAADAGEGVDLEELSDAVQDELARRAQEDAEYHVGAAVARGELVEVVRPDGQTGYAPAG